MVLKKVCTHCDTAQINIFYKKLICSNIQEIAQTPTEFTECYKRNIRKDIPLFILIINVI